MFIASDAGVRRATFKIFGGKIINHMFFKLFFEVKHPIFNAEGVRNLTRVFNASNAAASFCIEIFTRVGGPCSHRGAGNFMALLF